MNKVLVSTSTFAVSDDAPLKLLKEAGFEVVLNPYKRKLSQKELVELLLGAVGLIAGLETLDYAVMSQSTLKVISRCGAGLSNVDLKAAEKLGIIVCNTPDGPTDAVAELTVGCILALLRQVPLMNRDLHQGHWNKQTGWQLQGKTVVIAGMGRIGRRVARLLKPFQVHLIGVDPAVKNPDGNFELLALEEALPLADVVTLHCSGEECLLSEREFGLMKKGVFLLNAARGSLVDEHALIEALENGHVAGAWLDTFEQEPYDGPLRNFPQVLLTPHVGSYTHECRQKMERLAVENLLKVLIPVKERKYENQLQR